MYRKARNKAVGLLKSAKRKYYVSQLENNQNNAKELRKTIKSISGMNKQSKRVCSLKAGEHRVIDCLMNLSSNKASGIDKLSARLLKSAAPIIAPSIAKLINYSFSKSVFPRRWKTAKVFPLFKGGDLENVNNYRPISVFPVLSKVIERHVHDTLYSYLSENTDLS